MLGFRKAHREPIEVLKEGLGAEIGLATAIHVGAHFGEERADYEALGLAKVLWVEASAADYRELVARLAVKSNAATSHTAVNAFVADTGNQVLHLRRFSNEGASSSMYAATPMFKRYWPSVEDTGISEEVVTRTLDEIAMENGFAKPDLLVVDVQGAELLALKGGQSVLNHAKAVIVEVSRRRFYEGGVLYPELRDYLLRHGFREAHSAPRHGDQLYLRRNALRKVRTLAQRERRQSA
ncbi:MAG: FkbM family methyltransferase [Hyphomicrobiales bacterium]|nr:FkbM family methyltransferase [Hyphomicrobiales bacterium]